MNIANPTTCAVPTSTSSQNNGDPLGEFVQDTANPSLGHTTTYTYDHLNRLTSSVATPGQTGGAAHNLAFGYDRYGNMACVQNSNTNGPCGQWTFNAATNQITNTGFTYSYAGQLTNDGLHSYSWDAEGRLKQVDSGSTARYFYNALGWRVEKLVGSTYTEYLFGASGQPLGENNRSTTWAVGYVPLGFGAFALYENNATYFTHPNKIGSTAFVTDYTGAAVQDRIFYPWGQDWALGGTLYDERFASLRHRDTEAAFDPTPHRTYCSAYGRWLSPDPLGGEHLESPVPQSLFVCWGQSGGAHGFVGSLLARLPAWGLPVRHAGLPHRDAGL